MNTKVFLSLLVSVMLLLGCAHTKDSAPVEEFAAAEQAATPVVEASTDMQPVTAALVEAPAPPVLRTVERYSRGEAAGLFLTRVASHTSQRAVEARSTPTHTTAKDDDKRVRVTIQPYVRTMHLPKMTPQQKRTVSIVGISLGLLVIVVGVMFEQRKF